MPDYPMGGGQSVLDFIGLGGVKPTPQPPSAIPQPSVRDNIRVGANQIGNFLGETFIGNSSTPQPGAPTTGVPGIIEYLPVKFPFFAYLGTVLGVGVVKETVKSFPLRFLANFPAGALFNELVDPGVLGAGEEAAIHAQEQAALASIQRHRPTIPPMWLVDP